MAASQFKTRLCHICPSYSKKERKKMKTIMYSLTLTILMMFGSPMLAAQNEPTTEKPMAQQMEMMNSQMQTTQQKMKEIKATNNPEKRKVVMQQHMQSMREGMMMMGNMEAARTNMAMHMMQEKQPQMTCEQDNVQCQHMQTMGHRQEDIQERMKMMQMMMQQMMEHQSAQADQQ
jgi:protein CpxP